jgi:hypothetical protein
MVAQPGVRFGITNGVIIGALFVAAGAHLTSVETELLTVMVAGLASCGLSLAYTASAGVVAWAMFTGFVVNRYGLLTLEHDDLVRLATFTAATIALAVLAQRISVVGQENADG